MEIFDYFGNEQRSWIDKIRACDWSATKLLADLLGDNLQIKAQKVGKFPFEYVSIKLQQNRKDLK